MDVSTLNEIAAYKIPALRDSNLTVPTTPHIVLYSRGGYSDGLREAASAQGNITLVDVPAMLSS